MSSEGSDVTIIAAIMYPDGIIITIRVQLATIGSETAYSISMSHIFNKRKSVANVYNRDLIIIVCVNKCLSCHNFNLIINVLSCHNFSSKRPEKAILILE